MDREDVTLPDLLQQDQNGDVTRMILGFCVRVNLAYQPAMRCCAQTSRFLYEQVRELQEKDHRLAVWRSYRVLVPLWRADRHEEATDALIALMLQSSPGANEARMKKGRHFNANGTLTCWILSHCGLTALPVEFGTVRTTGNLYMSCNRIHYLPKTFGDITVGGCLHLSYNLLTSLPGRFGDITVGGSLSVSYNLLASLPGSFGNITVGENLQLSDNKLTSLPASFGNITVGASLFLNRNELTSLPGSFSNITVGEDVFLGCNELPYVPGSLGGVGGELRW